MLNYDSRFLDFAGEWTVTRKTGVADTAPRAVTAWLGHAIDAAGTFPVIMYLDKATVSRQGYCCCCCGCGGSCGVVAVALAGVELMLMLVVARSFFVTLVLWFFGTLLYTCMTEGILRWSQGAYVGMDKADPEPHANPGSSYYYPVCVCV